MRIAVIGAGLAGLAAARDLGGVAAVSVFEKSAVVGGRFAARRHEPYGFDHSAQFFTARSARMRDFIAPWLASGDLAEWRPQITTLSPQQKPYGRIWFEPHYVARPYMRRWCELLADGLDLHMDTEVVGIERAHDSWRVLDARGHDHGVFDRVVFATTAPTAARLAPAAFADLDQVRNLRMAPCYSLMLGFDEPPAVSWDCAVVRDAPIGWIAVDSRKPGRKSDFSMVVQSTNDWALVVDGLEADKAGTVLAETLVELTGIDANAAAFSDCRYWRYAKPLSPAGREFFLDEALGVAMCGDWCGGNRVEAAFLSGAACAEALAGKRGRL